MRAPIEFAKCEAREDEPHLAVFRNGHRECLWCKRVLETCCDGEPADSVDSRRSGTAEEPPTDTAESVQSDAELPTPAHLIGRKILDRYS